MYNAVFVCARARTHGGDVCASMQTPMKIDTPTINVSEGEVGTADAGEGEGEGQAG